MNKPLIAIDWVNVRMLSLEDDKTITVKVGDEEVQRFQFSSLEERDAAFKEWVQRGYLNTDGSGQ